ncbi:MAG: NPCBM/NEW2 domain-containing protein [Planctomycetes bacterium]|nr:NPCBM/NEW2 domain-containing protein [Planctomycetota bacterium]
MHARTPVVIALALLSLAIAGSAAEPAAPQAKTASLQPRVLTLAGTWIDGAATIASGSLSVGGQAIPLDRIIALEFPANPPPSSVDRAVALQNGDVLTGSVQSLQSSKLQFLSDSLGAITIAIADVRSLSFRPQRLSDLGRGSFQGVHLVNGDRIAGRIEWINDELIGIDTGKRIQKVPIRSALLWSAAASAKAPGRQCVRLANGDRLSGTVQALDAEKLQLQGTIGGDAAIPAARVSALWSEGAVLVPLSTLPPAESKQVPQFDESFPPTSDRDRSGSFLTCGDHRYERGLGCHARCEMTWDLAGAYATLVGELGLDDRAGERGLATITITADGAVVFESGPIAHGQAPLPLSVSLAGAKRLQLVVDFGPDGSSLGDAVDFGWAVLVKSRADAPH